MKKVVIIGIAVILLAVVIWFAPYTQSLESTFYGVDTASGEPVEVTLGLKRTRYLLMDDQLQAEITATCGDLEISDKQLQYIGPWPLGNKGEEVYYFIGWYLNLDVRYGDFSEKITSELEPIDVYLSKDFSKIALCYRPSEHANDTTLRQFVASTDRDRIQETITYFGDYAQHRTVHSAT